MMKNKIRMFAVVACFSLLMAGCKPSEQTYSMAYQKAKAAVEEDGGLDGTIYERMRKEAVPSATLADGTQLNMLTDYVKVVTDGNVSVTPKRYGVIAGRFKQVFNAKAMRSRLREAGWTNAYVVHTAEPLYYVVAADYDDVEPAAAGLKSLSEIKDLGLKTPYPHLLRNAYVK